jgi:hypothetical protein
MAIKCNCESGGACEIHPKSKLETKHYSDGSSATGVAPLPDQSPEQQTVPNEIPIEDRLTLKVLEAESLKAQMDIQVVVNTARQKAMQAQQQLDLFAATMFEKFGLKQENYVLDLEKLAFVPRNPEK